jgi:hypothetical protein
VIGAARSSSSNRQMRFPTIRQRLDDWYFPLHLYSRMNSGPNHDREEAEKLLREGWAPHPSVVGALCRKGTTWPAIDVAPPVWEAMRAIVADEKKTD